MVTVTGTFLRPDDTPCTGAVTFAVYVAASDTTPDNRVVTPAPVVVRLDDTGSFTVDLVASDDDGWQTDGPMPYTIGVNVTGQRAYNYAAYINDPGPWDIGELVVLDWPPNVANIPGLPGPEGPQGPQGEAALIVGSFTRDPAELPPDGFLPADWDSPGKPADDLQCLLGYAIVHYPSGHLWSFVGPEKYAPGWVDSGSIIGPEGPEGPPGTPEDLALGDLTDVSTAGATSGQALVSDGTNWAPGDVDSQLSIPLSGVSGRVYDLRRSQLASTSDAHVADRLIAALLYVGPTTIAALDAWVFTAVAGATLRLGLYLPDDSEGYPGTALAIPDGALDCSTTGSKQLTGLSVEASGWVWAVAQTGGAGGCTTRAYREELSWNLGRTSASDSQQSLMIRAVRTDSALPADLTGTSWIFDTNTPHGIRMVAL